MINWNRLLMWIEFAYLIRFQIIASLILAIALPAGYYLAPSIFVGLFDARDVISLSLVVWMAVQLAWTIMITWRLILAYGPDRFSGIQRLRPAQVEARPFAIQGVPLPVAGDNSGWYLVLFGLLAAPSVVMAYRGTELAFFPKLLAIAAGVVVAFIQLFLAARLHYHVEASDANSSFAAAKVFPSFGILKWQDNQTRSKFWRFADCIAQKLPEKLRLGLVRDGRIRSGHQVAATALFLELAVYVALGFALRPDHVLPEHEPAALFFALFLIMLVTWFFTGAAFFLDAARIPVLSTVLILSVLSGTLARTDHQFKVTGAAPSENAASSIVPSLTPADVVRAWQAARKKTPTDPVIVVATAGGGIRAAAWTTQVLTGLENDGQDSAKYQSCQSSLSSSVLAISSVSGGSVGSMFFLSGYGSAKEADFVFKPDNIVERASRSSLSAAGWGFLYPDLARAFPLLGMAVPQTIDRGWALENAWIAQWPSPPNINEWRRDAAAGKRPAAIFNATAAENGDRFLIASTDLEENVLSDAMGTLADKVTIQFSKRFPGYDVPVATAARLSASFPYVSPEAQPSDGPATSRFHIGDGGYYDNSGVLSALEWMEQAASALKGHPVLLLLIDSEPGTPGPAQRWSWQRQFVAPVDTLLNVRTASQQVRGAFETALAQRQFHFGSGLEVMPVSFLYSSSLPAPLSWHLTNAQKAAISQKWKEKPRERQQVMDFLGCKSAAP